MDPDLASTESGSRLATLNSDGSVPDTRLSKPEDAQSICWRWIWSDRFRSLQRARIKGLLDGNAPYSLTKLKAAGRAAACNVNWRMAPYFLRMGINAFYDTFSEAKTFWEIVTEFGTPDEAQRYSEIMTEESNEMARRREGFRYNQCISHAEMVTWGAGPLMFRDNHDWCPRAVQYKDLLVPEMTKSTTSEWEMFGVRQEYLCHQLYDLIKNPTQAESLGWNVKACKSAIMGAFPRGQTSNTLSWEYFEQRLKNGSLLFTEQSKVVPVDHLFFMEYPKPGKPYGRITHCIVLEFPTAASSAPLSPQDADASKDLADEFLYRKEDRFGDWNECIHPMYYDHGGGGYHHSVTGMGVDLYGAMEYHNRSLCRTADGFFAPKTMFKPTTADARETMSIANLGEYGILPFGFEAVQAPVNGFMDDGVKFNTLVTNLVTSNLSTYRTNLQQPETGNPVTATEVKADVANQAQLGKTQLDRYYDQLDGVYFEMQRRFNNVNLDVTPTVPGAKEALEYQKRCRDRGVPSQAFMKVRSCRACRVIGQGSPYARVQALQTLLNIIARYPEEGQASLIEDYTSAMVGRTVADRYTGMGRKTPPMPSDQQAEAWLEVAAMKTGIPAVVTGSQNPVVFAQIFLQAGTQAANAYKASQQAQQGGQMTQSTGADPHEVADFLTLIGPAVAQHLARFSKDPTRSAAYKALTAQLQQLGQFLDGLKQQIAQMAQQKAVQAVKAQQAQQEAAQQSKQDPRVAMEAAKTKAQLQMEGARTKQEMAIKGAAARQEQERHAQQLDQSQKKHEAELVQSEQRHRQNLAISDAQAAADIRRKKEELELKKQEAMKNGEDENAK